MNKKTVIVLIIFVALLGIIFTGFLGTQPVTEVIVLPKSVEFDITKLQDYLIKDAGTENQITIIYVRPIENSGALLIAGDEYNETPFNILSLIKLTLADGTVVALDESNVHEYLKFTLEVNNEEENSTAVTVDSLGNITFTRGITCRVTVQAKKASEVKAELMFEFMLNSGGTVDPEF